MKKLDSLLMVLAIAFTMSVYHISEHNQNLQSNTDMPVMYATTVYQEPDTTVTEVPEDGGIIEYPLPAWLTALIAAASVFLGAWKGRATATTTAQKKLDQGTDLLNGLLSVARKGSITSADVHDAINNWKELTGK